MVSSLVITVLFVVLANFIALSTAPCPSSAPVVRNGSLSQTGGTHSGAIRRLKCDPGFTRRGAGVVVCQFSDTWTNPGICVPNQPDVGPVTTMIPVPSDKVCGSLPTIANGVISGGCSTFGCKRTIQCNYGYVRRGYCKVYCRHGGNWDVRGRCERDDSIVLTGCGQPPTIANGFVQAGRSSLGSRRRIQCNAGFSHTGREYITCEITRRWSSGGRCVSSGQCPAPPSIAFGRIAAGGSEVGDRRQVVCNSGYSRVGQPTITCQSNRQWSSAGSCQAPSSDTCALLPNLPFGRIGPGFNKVGSRRRVRCNRGYRYQGQRSITCQANGQWTSPGTCTPRAGATTSCGALPQVENGHLTNGGSNIGDIRSVICDRGFAHVGETIFVSCQSNGQWSTPGFCLRTQAN